MPPVSPATITLGDSPVDYVILYNEPATLSGDQGGWRSAYTFGVAMGDHDAFCNFLAANEVEIDLGGGSSATRIIPCSDPVRPDLLCQKIDSRATGGYNGALPEALRCWSHARVRAEFGSVPYPTDGSTPFMVTRVSAAPEATSAAGRRLAFPDGTPISADASAIYTGERHAITIYNAPDVPDDDLQLTIDFSGTINSDVLFGRYPAYTVRYDGMDRETVRTTTNQVTVTKTLYLGFRAIDWRKALKGNWVWDFVVKPGGGYIYNAVPYAPLFA